MRAAPTLTCSPGVSTEISWPTCPAAASALKAEASASPPQGGGQRRPSRTAASRSLPLDTHRAGSHTAPMTKWIQHIVFDVEADGPCPGLYNMISFGLVSLADPSQGFLGEVAPLLDHGGIAAAR